tara:strand:- start:149 stop:2371 length:2223 start_codon:yes stop_codon:yes gene_type:complete
MKTQTFQTFRLRGVDDRWRVTPDSASDIREMSWDLNDGWRTAGGYDLISLDNIDSLSEFNSSGRVTSIHWYARHNGASRYTVFENQRGNLCKLNPRGFEGGAPAFIDLRDSENRVWDAGASLTSRTRFIPNASSAGSQSATFGGRLYIINGRDEPLVFDGRSTSRAGFGNQPSGPEATVIFRSDLLKEENTSGSSANTGYFLGTRVRSQGLGSCNPTGTYSDDSATYPDGKLCGYQYRVTFVNKRGQESPMSEASDMCTFECCQGKRRFTAVTIPVGGPDVVARRVYRTRDLLDDNGDAIFPESGRNFYFIKEVQDNETTMVEDGVPDSNVGELRDPEDFGAWPSQARYISVFKNTVFLAGMPGNEVRYSAPGMPEIFPLFNSFDVGGANSGEITGMHPTRNALVVFKQRGVYLIKGSPGAFDIVTLNEDVGCTAPNSIKELPGVGLAFLGSDGVYLLKGALENTGTITGVVDLSVPIKKTLKRMDRSNAIGAVGVINRSDKEYWLCIPTIGQRNNLLLIFHYEVGSWSFREHYPIQCAVEVRDDRNYLYFGSHDTTMPGVHVFSNGYRGKNVFGSSATGEQAGSLTHVVSRRDYPYYETAPLDFGSVFKGIQVGYVNCYVLGYGDGKVNVNFKINRSIDLALTSDRMVSHKDLVNPLAVYSTATWNSDGKWGYHKPVSLRFDVSHMHKEMVQEIQVRFSQDENSDIANRFQLFGWDMNAKVGEQRNIRLLTNALDEGGN